MISILLMSGCGLSASIASQQQQMAAMQAQARERVAAAQAAIHSGAFVAPEHAWLCVDEAAARAQTACPGGTELDHNEDVMLVGTQPTNGVWQVAIYDASGEHRLYVAASSVAEVPDLAAQNAYAAELTSRISPDKLIHLDAITFDRLITQPASFRGKLLVVRQSTDLVSNESYDAATSTYTFTIPIPVETGSPWAALAQFELANKQIVEGSIKRHHEHSCTTKYCDKLVIVAELTGRTVDRIDETGALHRLPVFVVHELGDRFGVYR
jgi:hypothetical protein